MPRILVVDDEPLISMLVEGWLAELGCDVVGPARSVEEGLDLADDAKLDAAILDVNLAGENSYSVANALQEKGVYRSPSPPETVASRPTRVSTIRSFSPSPSISMR